jgi:hypothetical protein
MPHKYMHPCFKSCNVTTKISIITPILQHIIFIAIRNSKLVTAQRGTSQLVIPHKFKHPRFKSDNVTTKKFQSLQYTTYIFHNSTKFKARRHNTAQLVMPHECTHPLFKSYVMCGYKQFRSIIYKTKLIACICNTTYIFRRNMKFKARHVTSHGGNRAARRSSSCRTNMCIHFFKSCNVTTKKFVHYICNTVQHIFFTAIRNLKLVTARRSLSCRTNVHIHVSSHVIRRQKISFITSIIRHIFFTAI